MKTFYIITISLLVLLACKSEKTTPQVTVQKIDTTQSVSFNPPGLEDNYYRELFKYQQEIILNPGNRQVKEKYIYNVYFADNNTLVSFGCARKTNPNTQQAIAYPLIKRAALLDAKRWGTYGLLWLNNDFKPDFGKIRDIHSGETKEVFTFNVGDSLVIALANKVR